MDFLLELHLLLHNSFALDEGIAIGDWRLAFGFDLGSIIHKVMLQLDVSFLEKGLSLYISVLLQNVEFPEHRDLDLVEER